MKNTLKHDILDLDNVKKKLHRGCMAKKKTTHTHTHTKTINLIKSIYSLIKTNLNTKYLRIRITDNPFVNPLLKDIKIWNTSLHKKGIIINHIQNNQFIPNMSQGQKHK